MAKNDKQFNVHESEFFEIIQNIKLFEFLRPSCTMVLGIPNPFLDLWFTSKFNFDEMANKTIIFKNCLMNLMY